MHRCRRAAGLCHLQTLPRKLRSTRFDPKLPFTGQKLATQLSHIFLEHLDSFGAASTS